MKIFRKILIGIGGFMLLAPLVALIPNQRATPAATSHQDDPLPLTLDLARNSDLELAEPNQTNEGHIVLNVCEKGSSTGYGYFASITSLNPLRLSTFKKALPVSEVIVLSQKSWRRAKEQAGIKWISGVGDPDTYRVWPKGYRDKQIVERGTSFTPLTNIPDGLGATGLYALTEVDGKLTVRHYKVSRNGSVVKDAEVPLAIIPQVDHVLVAAASS